MPYHEDLFMDSVEKFADKHHRVLAKLFGLNSSETTKKDLILLLEHSVGEQTKALFERTGRLDTSLLHEIFNIPASQRSLQRLAPKIARQEIGMAMNKPIHQATLINPRYGAALGDYIMIWRRNRMRREMQALASSARDIEAFTLRLLSAIDKYRDQPNLTNRLYVRAAIRAVNKSLLKAHHRARIGSVWALRAGYASDAVTRAVNRLYLKRMRNLSIGMAKIDQWLGGNGIPSKIAEGILRRHKIMTRELMAASANPELLRPKTRYPKDRILKDIGDISYG